MRGGPLPQSSLRSASPLGEGAYARPAFLRPRKGEAYDVSCAKKEPFAEL